jgi:hypothetical protein
VGLTIPERESGDVIADLNRADDGRKWGGQGDIWAYGAGYASQQFADWRRVWRHGLMNGGVRLGAEASAVLPHACMTLVNEWVKWGTVVFGKSAR